MISATLRSSCLAVGLILASLLLSPAVHAVLQTYPSNATLSSTSDFTIRVTPSSMTVVHSLSLSAEITVTSFNNFAGTVILASIASLPTGPSPTSVTLTPNGTATSILYFDTYFVPPGEYLVNITGTSGNLDHWTTLNINLVGPDFQINSSQTVITEVPNGLIVNASRITVTSVDYFSGPVRFFAYSPGSFIQTEFSPGTVTIPTNGTSTSELTILGGPSSTRLGTYSLVVGASNAQGSLVPLTHTTTIQLRIKHTIGPTVTINSLSISRTGDQATVTVNFSTNDPDGTVEASNIQWGDGTNTLNLPGTTATESHVYNFPGAFTITITARDSTGAISPAATKSVNLNTPSPSTTLGLLSGSLAPPLLYATIGATIAIIASAIALVNRRKSTRAS